MGGEMVKRVAWLSKRNGYYCSLCQDNETTSLLKLTSAPGNFFFLVKQEVIGRGINFFFSRSPSIQAATLLHSLSQELLIHREKYSFSLQSWLAKPRGGSVNSFVSRMTPTHTGRVTDSSWSCPPCAASGWNQGLLWQRKHPDHEDGGQTKQLKCCVIHDFRVFLFLCWSGTNFYSFSLNQITAWTTSPSVFVNDRE